jgi:hypothetical protein
VLCIGREISHSPRERLELDRKCSSPLTRPPGTLSHEGRGGDCGGAGPSLLPLWEKVARSAG